MSLLWQDDLDDELRAILRAWSEAPRLEPDPDNMPLASRSLLIFAAILFRHYEKEEYVKRQKGEAYGPERV